MKINAQQNDYQYHKGFKGLNKSLSKVLFEKARSISDLSAIYSKSNGVVGKIPHEWINQISKDKKEDTIKKIYKCFRKSINQYRQFHNIEECSNKLNQCLHNAKIIKSNENLILQRIDNGSYGTVYHLKGVFNDNYVIKVFRYNNDYFVSSEKCVHGNNIELNRAAFWQKNVGKKTQMVKFYFGDVDAGYMINKYIGNQTPICKSYVDPAIYGLKSHDICQNEFMTGSNKIRGYIIDYGGIEIENKELVRNKKEQEILKKFLADTTKKQTHPGLLFRKKAYNQLLREKIGIFENGDKNIKLLLAKNIHNLPKCIQVDCFKYFLGQEDSEITDELFNEIRLFKIKGKEQFLCYEIFRKKIS